MLQLFGSPVSNCYNTVLSALYHKGLAFEEQVISASMEGAFLAHSPMGKIPYIVDGANSVSETSAIVEYLDEVYPGPSLFPGTALQRARQRQLMKFIELYVESPVRRLFPGVFWCQQNAALHVEEVRPIMERGLGAAEGLLAMNQDLFELPTGAAGFYSYFSLVLAATVAEQQYGWDLLCNYPVLRRYVQSLDELDFIGGIVEQRDTAMVGYLQKKAAEAAAEQ